jgi:hypothetical protein
MKQNSQSENYSKKEAKRRFEAALRGARLVGHKPQSEMRIGKRSGAPKQKARKQRVKPPR